jgi:hypothetical protein
MHRRQWTVAAVVSLLAPLAFAGPAQAAVTPLAKINFQPAAGAVPAGYTADTGLAFDTARGSGWVRQDSLSGTRVPLNLTANTRNRARAGIDARLNTLIHLQYGDVGGSSGVLTAGAYEYVVPNGDYQVLVSAGDQPAYDSSHTVRVEGVTAIAGFVSTAAAEFRQATVTVPVTDGRLTVDAVGGTNTKLNYLEIGRVTTTPAAPTGPAAAPGDAQVSLTWTASTAADVTGYRVYRGGTLIASPTRNAYLDLAVSNGTAYGYAVSAVDNGGAEYRAPPW